MFANLSAKIFKIDTIVPVIQTAAVVGVNEVLGRLGQYSVSFRAAILIGGVASLVTAISRNIFDNRLALHASTVIGVVAGINASRFFYPSIQSFDPKAALVIGGSLFVIQTAVDIARRPRIAPVETTTTT